MCDYLGADPCDYIVMFSPNFLWLCNSIEQSTQLRQWLEIKQQG